MKVLVIGDSIVSGENNRGKSFVDYMSGVGSVIKVGVSGTTLDEYSLYPVEGYSLLAQIKRYEVAVKQADVIVLHYGVNDASALTLGNVSIRQVVIAFVKALDYLTQLNPKAKICCLTLSSLQEVLVPYAKMHCSYLEEYYRGYDMSIDWRKWYEFYRAFQSLVEIRVKLFPLVDSLDWLQEHLDEDQIHFTDEGYKEIGLKVSRFLRRGL